MESTIEEQLKLIEPETGRVLMTVCLNLTLFFRGASTPEKRQAILAIFAEYQQLMQGKLNWTTNPQTGAWKNLQKKSYVEPKDWLLKLEDEPWEFIYHGGQHHRDACDIRFSILSKAKWQENTGAISWLTVNFPLTFFADQKKTFQDLVIRWTQRLQPIHGFAAIATTHNHFDDYQHEPYEYQWAQQFPGLDISNHIRLGLRLNNEIKGINWLTVISQQHMDQVGGLDAFKSINGLKIWQAGAAYLIQAADKPALKTIPETYYRLAKLLAPVRKQKLTNIHNSKGEGGTFSGPEYWQWLARFEK